MKACFFVGGHLNFATLPTVNATFAMHVFLIDSSDDVRADVRKFFSNCRILINEEMSEQGYKLLITKEKYESIYKDKHVFFQIVILVVVGSSPISHPKYKSPSGSGRAFLLGVLGSLQAPQFTMTSLPMTAREPMRA